MLSFLLKQVSKKTLFTALFQRSWCYSDDITTSKLVLEICDYASRTSCKVNKQNNFLVQLMESRWGCSPNLRLKPAVRNFSSPPSGEWEQLHKHRWRMLMTCTHRCTWTRLPLWTWSLCFIWSIRDSSWIPLKFLLHSSSCCSLRHR